MSNRPDLYKRGSMPANVTLQRGNAPTQLSNSGNYHAPQNNNNNNNNNVQRGMAPQRGGGMMQRGGGGGPPQLNRQSTWQSSSDSIKRGNSKKMDLSEARLESIFREFDEDNSGFISAQELRKSLLEKFKLHLDHDNALLLLQRCDENNDGEISLDEFCVIIDLVLQMKKEFDSADVDGSNAISANELKTLLNKMKLPLTANHVKILMSIFDDDGSGEIEYQEFFNLILYVKEIEYQYSKRNTGGNGNSTAWISKLLGQSTANDSTLLSQLNSPLSSTFENFFTCILEALARNKSRERAPRVMKVRKPRKKAPRRAPPAVQRKATISNMDRRSVRQNYIRVNNDNVYTRNSPFIDQKFPANASILGKLAGKVASWRRPYQISRNPRLFVDGVDEGDVIQGSLGDCWFLGALSVVATSGNSFIEKSFVNSNWEGGRHVVKFFKDGKWVEVEVDDLIPCNGDGKPAFASCRDPDEFWVPILEKAYAKLHGGYFALESGNISYGLKDLTGEAVEELRLDEPETLPSGPNLNNLWGLFIENLQESFLMGCSIISPAAMAEEKNSYDLLLNHAYGIIDCQNIKGNRLIRLRNPWGNFEWNGRWSDGSPEWTPDLLAHFGNYEFDNDGTFFMCFEDFVQFFNSIHVLRLLTDDVGEVWDKFEVDGEWNSETAGGFLSFPTWTQNPQYSILPTRPNTRVFICISQADLRYHGKPQCKYESMGIQITKGDHNTTAGSKKVSCRNDEKVKTSIFLAGRDNSIEFLADNPNTSYVVIPSLYRPKYETTFSMMFYSQYPVIIKELKSGPGSVSMGGPNLRGSGSGRDRSQGGPALVSNGGIIGGLSGRFNGEWNTLSSGGCLNHESWMNNPQYILNAPQPNADVTISLVQDDSIMPLDYIGFYIFDGKHLKGCTINSIIKPIHRVQMTNLVEVSSTVKIPTADPYYIMPCTFDPKKERKFTLSAFANGQVLQIRKAKDWTTEASKGEWTPQLAGGSMNHNTWRVNPRYVLQISNNKVSLDIVMKLQAPVSSPIGFYLFLDKTGDNQPNIMNIMAQAKFSNTSANSLPVSLDPGKYLLIVCTYVPNILGSFFIGAISEGSSYKLTRIQ